MPHVRSPEAKLRREKWRAAKRIMLENAFNDRFNGDVVNLLRTEQVIRLVQVEFPQWDIPPQAIPCCAERGMVLSDPYGRGAFQQVEV
jgi:hypothetical protein